MVKIQCQNGHEYEMYFEDPKHPECDHDTSDTIRGVCVQCAMAEDRPEPDSRCPECGAMPARILEQPAVTIKFVRR